MERLAPIQRSTVLLLATFACLFGAEATLSPSFNPPAALGQSITWNASTDSASQANIRYRFVVYPVGGEIQVLRDFSPDPFLTWTPSKREGTYVIEMMARDIVSGEILSAAQQFEVLPRIQGTQSQVNPTSNSLVFLFSAPACQEGSRMRVDFVPADVSASTSPAMQSTPYRDCDGQSTMNFYLAGMLPQAEYRAYATIDAGDGSSPVQEAAVSFTTGDAPLLQETMHLIQAPPPGAGQPVLLTSNGFATNLQGVPIWGNASPVTILARPDAGGYFWGFVEDQNFDLAHQAIRKFDLLGNIVLETNAERVNEQLAAMGKRTISSFHHEVRSLPDGRILALASVEQLLTDVQGPGTVNVLGDMIVVFDQYLNVVWTWDTFDWLDVRREAVLGEVCDPGGGGCPPFYLANRANDWTHGNAVQQTPDGALLYSARHQDWLIKINYDYGNGDGQVLWRLGPDGDFTYISSNPWPWFSHQHDGNFLTEDPTKLLVFDNGNTRWKLFGEAESRGQEIQLDEANRIARLPLNANLGVLAAAVGSAQKLHNGNYHFDAGYVIQPDNTLAAFAFEVDSSGRIRYELKTDGFVYRSFRMQDLYTLE